MRGVPIGSPSRSDYALRRGARIRPTALRSFLSKPESETSLSSVVTSAGGDTKDTYCGYTSFVTSAGGDTKDTYYKYTSFVTSAGGDTKDPCYRHTSFVTSTGGDTKDSILQIHVVCDLRWRSDESSPPVGGRSPNDWGDKTSSIDRPLVGRTRNSLLANDLEGGDSFTATHSDDIAATW